MSHEVEIVKFHDDQIEAIRNGGLERYVVIRRICENLGVAVQGQLKSLKGHHWSSITMIVIETSEGPRETACLPLDQLPMWMAVINARKVAPEIRPKLKLYQIEVCKVLAAHFGPQLQPHDYLGKILAKYISPELCQWSKTFPDEFYYHMCRLRGWEWNPLTHQTPIQAARDTIDVVYARLAPGVIEELQRLVPRDENGKLVAKLHQQLTIEWGRLKLQTHLSNVICLMKSCDTWRQFKGLLRRSLPKHGEHMYQYLSLEYEDEE